MKFDLIIKNGRYFDGTANRGQGATRDVGIRSGRVTLVCSEPLDERDAASVIDAKGMWVMPGFIEPHSHYDAEVIAAPGLKESIRHGVTTAVIGSCSLSMIYSDFQDCADLFTRVESVPRDQVIPLLRHKKFWNSAADYRRFFETHPIGPNIASYVGHSDLRVAVMGMDRATRAIQPSDEELQQMGDMLHSALDQGLLGLSVMTTKLDRVDGDVAWSRPLPSTFAHWHEFAHLFDILRSRRGVLQGAPDSVGKINILGFLWHASATCRRQLKTSLLTAMDLKSQPHLHWLTRLSGWVAVHILRADWRWQMLPAPATLYCDGLDFNNFEEFTGGQIIRDIKDKQAQYAKIADPTFRAQFKKDLKRAVGGGLWHRDFSDACVVDCPDKSLISKDFAEIGRSRGGIDGIDAFFDLCITYQDKLRWKTVVGNHRPDVMHKMLASRYTQIGFADSGAHLRNIAFYNFPLRFLKYVRDAENVGIPFMPLGAAVHRLTGELGDWFGLDAGHLRLGDRADIVIINPEGLNDELDQVHQAPAEGLGITRLVNRNDAAVEYTLINGRVAYSRAQGYAADLGRSQDYGRFLAGTHIT